MIKKIISVILISLTLYSFVNSASNQDQLCKAVIAAPQIERTFAIIKPDAVAAKNSGEIINLIEKNKFNIIGMQKTNLHQKQASEFYKAHKDKPFFKSLIEYMTSGPAIILALEKENAIKEWRDLMGTTNPANAAPGTMRRMFGTSITNNATHGSDSKENAQVELNFFFPELK